MSTIWANDEKKPLLSGLQKEHHQLQEHQFAENHSKVKVMNISSRKNDDLTTIKSIITNADVWEETR